MHPSTASAAPAVLPLARCPSVRPSDWPRHVGARHNSAAKIGLLEGFHVLVLLCVFPCTVFWWPVYRSNVYGNLVLLDCAFLTLWTTSLALLMRHSHLPFRTRQCVKVCVFAVLAGCGSAVGSLVYGQTANLANDLLRHMKVLGFASIIPLSLSLASTARIHRLVAASAVLSTTFNVAVRVTGYQDRLPLFTEFSDLGRIQVVRPTGAVSNPNDYAYISILGLAFAAALYSTRKRSAALPRILCFGAIVASLYGAVTSGSRSAIVGVLCGAVYYITRRRISIAKKVGLVLMSALVLVIAWRESSVFQDRMDAAMTQRLKELNVVGRIEAQSIAVRTWFAWPLGVGASNMPAATFPHSGDAQLVTAVEGSDSIYVDYLLGAGIQGLVLLLLCFGTCWKLAAPVGPTSGTTVLQSTIVCIFVCGCASVAPASAFVSPFFFALVGLAALREMAPKAPRLS